MFIEKIRHNQKNRERTVRKKISAIGYRPEKRFDEITKEAALSLKMPVSTLSIFDSDKKITKSVYSSQKNTEKDLGSLCQHTLLSKSVFVVEDTHTDKRFLNDPLMCDIPNTRFYAGVPMFDYKSGLPIGIFCVKDEKPRYLKEKEIRKLARLAHLAERELNSAMV